MPQGVASKWVVKERFGAGSQNIGLDLDELQAINHAKKLEQPIFQPMIKNQQEISVDLYITKNYHVKNMLLRTRDLVVHGESQITTNFFNKKIESAMRNFALKTGLIGHLVIQAFIDNDKITLIECNARFGGASSFSQRLGVDSFFWFYLECCGFKIDEWPILDLNSRLVQIRYPQDELREYTDL